MDTQKMNDQMFGKSDNSGGRVILIVLVIVLVLVGLLIANVSKAHADGTLRENQSGITYSACTNPGQFYGDEIEVEKYRSIYLGYCTPRGEGITDNSHRKDNDESESPVTVDQQMEESPVQSNDDNPPAAPADSPKDDKPADDKPAKGNNGHGNNSDGIDSSNPGNGPKNDPAVDPSSPVDDEKKGQTNSGAWLAGFVFVTFRKGKKEYCATVSSWSYSGHNLWLFIWSEEGIDGNCGYVPYGRVTGTSKSDVGHPYISPDTLKVIRAWE